MDKTVHKKLEDFFSQFEKKQFQKGEILIRAQNPINSVYFLKKGYVRQFLITENGNDITLHLFKENSYFPLMLILGNAQNIYNFEAKSTIDTWKAPKNKVLQFIEKNPDVLLDLTKRLSAGINGLLLKIANETYRSAHYKVLSLLLYLAKRFGEKDASGIKILLPLTHNEIASWVGVQRETVSRNIEKLQSKKIIGHSNETLVIYRLDKLRDELLLD